MTPYQALPPFDWPGLLALIRRAFAGMEGRIDPPTSLHRLTAEGLARHAAEGEVWVIGTPPLACVVLTPLPDALYVGKLAVEPGQQRQGYGRALVDLAGARARAMGLPALDLSVRVELVENQKTFTAMGFRQTAATSHPGYDRVTSLSFRKTL